MTFCTSYCTVPMEDFEDLAQVHPFGLDDRIEGLILECYGDFENQEIKSGFMEITEHDVKHGNIDFFMEAAQKGLRFFGYHDGGDGYDAMRFAAWNGTLYEIPMLDEGEPYVPWCSVHTVGWLDAYYTYAAAQDAVARVCDGKSADPYFVSPVNEPFVGSQEENESLQLAIWDLSADTKVLDTIAIVDKVSRNCDVDLTKDALNSLIEVGQVEAAGYLAARMAARNCRTDT